MLNTHVHLNYPNFPSPHVERTCWTPHVFLNTHVERPMLTTMLSAHVEHLCWASMLNAPCKTPHVKRLCWTEVYVGRPYWTPHVMLYAFGCTPHVERLQRETLQGDPKGRPRRETQRRKSIRLLPPPPLGWAMERRPKSMRTFSRWLCSLEPKGGQNLAPTERVSKLADGIQFKKKNCVFGYRASWKVDIREASGRFWSALRGRRSTKNRDACNKMEFLGYIGVCARGQMRHEKSTSVRQVFGPSAI